MKYQIIPVTPFEQNCSLLWCAKSKQAGLVDPGGDEEKIKVAVEENQVHPSVILLTHGHLDHVGAAPSLANYYNIPIYGPQEADNFWLSMLSEQSQLFGLRMTCDAFLPNKWLNEGDIITIGEEQLNVFHCPGHTPGHVVYFCQKDKLLLAGDVIFRGSVGRSDFPHGDHQQLIAAIKAKLLPLGDDVNIISGHGPMSTIGHERKTNRFLIS